MTQIQVLILAVIQSLAEFLPVSSSAHLILLSQLSPLPDQGVEFDVAVHVGSVLAILIYFYKDIWAVVRDAFVLKFMPDFRIYGSRLFWLIAIGSIPAIVAGLCLYYSGSDWTRNIRIIGWNIIIFGLILWFADTKSKSVKKIDDMSIKDAVLIGIAQAMALIPGTSRSGITITMARFLGVERREAAKFSMLLSIPVIFGAGLIAAFEIQKNGEILNAASGVVYSFMASILVIFFMMNWLKKFSFLPFVIYRLTLGISLLLYSYDIF